MKPRSFLTIGILSILLPLVVTAESTTVITKENAIRESCKFVAPVKAQVRYNDVLEIISTEGDWFKVRFKTVQGCIHKTGVEKKTVSTAGSFFPRKSSGVSESEASLAGKGFNLQVESSYKQKHPEMKYNLVDYVEKLDTQVSDKDFAQFITRGGLKQP